MARPTESSKRLPLKSQHQDRLFWAKLTALWHRERMREVYAKTGMEPHDARHRANKEALDVAIKNGKIAYVGPHPPRNQATEEISAQITAVQEETKDTVTAIENIMSVISEISDISTTIASAVEEQGVSTQEIARNVQQAAQGTQDVNANIESVYRAAGETGAAAGQVLNASQEMSRQAEGLRAEVERFLSEIRAA